MKKALHLVKIDDLGDPDIHQLVREFSADLNWIPEGLGNLSLFTFFSLCAKNGLHAIKASSFATDGIWSKKVSELPVDGQLLQFLKSACSNYRGGSLEQFGNSRVLDLLKKLFPKPLASLKNSAKPTKSVRTAKIILQRRRNGDL